MNSFGFILQRLLRKNSFGLTRQHSNMFGLMYFLIQKLTAKGLKFYCHGPLTMVWIKRGKISVNV